MTQRANLVFLLDCHKREALIARLKDKLDQVDFAERETLRSLYDGCVFPAEMSYANAPGYSVLLKTMADASAGIQTFTVDAPDLCAALDAYRDALDNMAELLCREQFVQGFTLAVRMIMESM